VTAFLLSNGLVGPAGLTAVLSLVTYLVMPKERPPRYGLESEFPVRSHEFLGSIIGATGVPFVKGNKVTILNNGDQFFPAMLDAIGGAQFTVTIEAYIYWAGEVGRQFAAALAEKAREGVAVKVLLDSVGSATIGREIQAILKDGGVEVGWYNPIRWSSMPRFNHRTHRKSLIVDGRIGFTGGAGIADVWSGNAQDPDHWREIQVELVTGPGYFPPHDSAGSMSVQTIMSSPEAGSSTVRILYYLSIVCARKSIWIANPYFIPDDVAVEILMEARQRGVDVKIMVAGRHNDMPISRYASIQLYGKLLDAGIEIYEYSTTMMHQKTMVIDGIWSTIGTTNFDNRSFSLSEESNICLYDERFARELEQIYERDLGECERITTDGWRKRGAAARVTGAFSLFLKEQI
jgi:cardiolipin synthase